MVSNLSLVGQGPIPELVNNKTVNQPGIPYKLVTWPFRKLGILSKANNQ